MIINLLELKIYFNYKIILLYADKTVTYFVNVNDYNNKLYYKHLNSDKIF